MSDLPLPSAEQVEALNPAERTLVERQPERPWLHPLRIARWEPYLQRFQCRFCLELDGTAASTDLGRIGFTTEVQFTEHMERSHQHETPPPVDPDADPFGEFDYDQAHGDR